MKFPTYLSSLVLLVHLSVIAVYQGLTQFCKAAFPLDSTSKVTAF